MGKLYARARFFVMLIMGLSMFIIAAEIFAEVEERQSDKVILSDNHSKVTTKSRKKFRGILAGQLSVEDISGHTIALQFYERKNGKVLIHVLGATNSITASQGIIQNGSELSWTLVAKDPMKTNNIEFNGNLVGSTFTGEAFDGENIIPVVLTEQSGVFDERQLVFLLGSEVPETEPEGLTEISLALDNEGRFISGYFSGWSDCVLLGCSGIVSSFSEEIAQDEKITVGLESEDRCFIIKATFDPESKLYNGSYQLVDCQDQSQIGEDVSIIGAKGNRWRTNHVAKMFKSLSSIADGLESDTNFIAPYYLNKYNILENPLLEEYDVQLPIIAPYRPISTDYLNFGKTASILLDELNTQVADYSSIDVEFSHFNSIKTIDDPDTYEELQRPFGLEFHDIRTGIPAGDIEAVTYYNNTVIPSKRELNIFKKESRRWVIYGNQVGEFDLPFDYNLGTYYLEIPVAVGTPNQGTIYASVGGFGAHFGPLTGHSYGDAKSNIAGYYVPTVRDMVELKNGIDGTLGVCEPDIADEICGFYGGTSGEIIRDRIPTYLAPLDATISKVIYYQRPNPASDYGYFDNVAQWQVQLRLEGDLNLTLGHLGKISQDLRDKIIAATGIDTDTYAPSSDPQDPDYCPSYPDYCDVDILNGATIPVLAGELLAQPQVDAYEVDPVLYPGYYKGGHIGSSLIPWAQMEMSFLISADDSGDYGLTCIYDCMLSERKDNIQHLMEADMLNPETYRYREQFGTESWMWKAEGLVCNAPAEGSKSDFSSIHTRLGGWFERESGGTTPDEVFAIVPIQKESAVYDETLYSSNVNHLFVRRKKQGSGVYAWVMPDGEVLEIYYPAGEVLEETDSGLLIKWRDIGYDNPLESGNDVVYQRMSFLLDNEGIKVRLGDFSDTIIGATAPSLSPEDPCNDTDILCYDHTYRSGF